MDQVFKANKQHNLKNRNHNFTQVMTLKEKIRNSSNKNSNMLKPNKKMLKNVLTFHHKNIESCL